MCCGFNSKCNPTLAKCWSLIAQYEIAQIDSERGRGDMIIRTTCSRMQLVSHALDLLMLQYSKTGGNGMYNMW